MNKKWENDQLDKLVAKQKNKIAKLQTKVDQEHPIIEPTKNYTRPNTPLNS